MKRSLLIALLLSVTPLLVIPAVAQQAQLDYGEDYTFNDEVHQVSTVQVAENRVPHYLAGLARSWVPANEIAVDMGLMKDYKIYVSELPNGGDFNVMLVEVYENAAQRTRMDDPDVSTEFMTRFEESLSEQDRFQVTEGYATIRDIVGEYLMREVQLK